MRVCYSLFLRKQKLQSNFFGSDIYAQIKNIEKVLTRQSSFEFLDLCKVGVHSFAFTNYLNRFRMVL